MLSNSKTLLCAAWMAFSAPAWAQSSTDDKKQSGAGSGSGSSQEYEGPSIVTRDKSLIGERGGKLLDYRFYAAITGSYDSGLTPVSTDQNGNLVHVGGNEGMDIGFGVVGSRTWRRDSLSVDYHGSYRHYVSNSFFDGTDQFLNLRYSHVVSRHVIVDFKETAGISSLGNGGFSYLPLTSVDTFVPTNELFDNTTYFSQTRAGFVWQKSARLSFGLSSDLYAVRRRSKALAGMDGYSVQGDVSYRVTRRQTFSLNYGLQKYNYQHTFGDAFVQTLSLGYSIGLGRRWSASAAAGGSYSTIRGLQTVNVDPAIVAIIGQATIVQNFDRTVAVPYFSAQVVRRFPRSTLGITASTGVSPGNGVYLASRQSTAGTQYSYAGLRRFTMGGNFGYTELSTLGQSLGKYTGFQGGVGATYKISNLMHAEFRYDYRHYTTQSDIFQKDSHRVSLGLAFSPGEKPLPIW